MEKLFHKLCGQQNNIEIMIKAYLREINAMTYSVCDFVMDLYLG